MKYFSLILAFAISSLIPKAQIVARSTFGNSFDTIPCVRVPDGFITIIKEGKDESAIGFNKHKSRIALVKHNKERIAVKEMPLTNGDFIFNSHFTALRQIGNKYWFFYLELAATKNSIGDIKAIEIDPVTLETSAPKLVIASATSNLEFKQASRFFNFIALFKSSPSDKYLSLVLTTDKKTFYMAYFDEQLNTIWGRRDEQNDINKEAEISVTTDEKGAIYLGYIKKDAGQVICYTKNTIKNVSFQLGDVKPVNIELIALKKQNAIAIAGTYKEKSYTSAGVYQAILNNDNYTVGEINKTRFPENIVNMYSKEGLGKTKDKLYGLEMSMGLHFTELENGSVSLLIEPGDENTSFYCFFGSILHVNFAKGSAVFTRIPKYNAQPCGFMRNKNFLASSAGDKIYVVYLDDVKNLDKDINSEPDLCKNCSYVMAIINSNGTVVRKSLPIQYLLLQEMIAAVE